MEKQVIQSVGFRNILEDGKAVGFQFKIRLPYYRGVFLSQIKAGLLIVDGETFTKDQYLGFFTQENPAPAKVAEQWAVFLPAYNVLNEAYQFDKYSLDTKKLEKTDDDCDHTFMAVKKMTQAQQAFEFNLPVKEAADRMMVCIDKYDINVEEDYLGENNKLQQIMVIMLTCQNQIY